MNRSWLALLGLTFIGVQMGASTWLGRPDNIVQLLSDSACLYGTALVFGVVVFLGSGGGWWLIVAYTLATFISAAVPLLIPVPAAFGLLIGPLAMTAGPLAYGLIAAGQEPVRA